MRGVQLTFDFDRHAALHERLEGALEDASLQLDRMRGSRERQRLVGRQIVEGLRRTVPPHSAWEAERLLPRLGPGHEAAELRFELALFPRWLDELDAHLDAGELAPFRRRARFLLALLRDHLRGEEEAA